MQLAQVFTSPEGREIRTVMRDGEPWFVAMDVAAHMDIANVRQVDIDADSRGVCTVYTPSGAQDMVVLSEAGLYQLIFVSRKPEAKAFRKWVTGEVLPAIRKTGSYAIAQQPSLPDFSNPSAAARAWADAHDARIAAEAQAAEAIRTKAMIGSRREATAMASAAAAAKKVKKLEIALDKSKDYASVKRVQIETGRTYAWHKLRKLSQSMDLAPRDVEDANYGSVKAYHRLVWVAAYGVDIRTFR